ncbi:hypothetical protein M9Y10_045780 [Tritrichomonas musculus]|uniref:NADPH--hemoprotein reductase n=1 Tax=Tritrichomonas musculus TaxID=1915356 RepID=A0ABR2JW74_9EUKA
MIQVTINGHSYSFQKDISILEACREKNIYIPTLCYHDDLPASGKCGLCVVKINGSTFAHACIQKIKNGMNIETTSADVIAQARRAYNNFIDMSVPPPSKDIEEISKYLFPKNTVRTRESDQSNSLDFDPSLCINCGRCVRMCSDVQNINALNYQNPRIRNNECISCGQCISVCPTEALKSHSSKSELLSALAEKKTLILQIAPATRVAIGECFGYDPGTIVTGKVIQAARKLGFKYVFDTNFGADMTVIEEGNELLRRMKIKVDSTFEDKSEKKIELASFSDATNYALKKSSGCFSVVSSLSNMPPLPMRSPSGIFFRPQVTRTTINTPSCPSFINMPPTTNTNTTSTNRCPQGNKIMNKKLDPLMPLDDIFTSNSQEIQCHSKSYHESNVLPQFTSCCPAWVNYVEKLHHELIPNLSSTKSPHMIVAKLVKTYFASMMNIDPKEIFMVSLMPCVAKKDEIRRMQLTGDCDAVITSQEFAALVDEFGIIFKSLTDSEFDSLLGASSGAGQIFGTTGGVAEATIRYIHKLITKKPLTDKIEYEAFRGMKTIKTSTIKIDSHQFKIAVCNGISAVNELIETDKYKGFDFIEVMACPGGCIGGAGQPYLRKSRMQERMNGIYSIDKSKEVRVADENPDLQTVYRTFVGQPGTPKAHHLLHTHFEPQESAILAQRRRMMSMPIVAYGSASGTAMKFARIVAKFIGTKSVAINNLTVKQLIARKVAIFIVSTIGEGEFPMNSRKFVKELSNSMEGLSDVRFAVCGLGNQSYKYFCRAGIELDQYLEQHLARPIVPLVKIDTSTEDKGETDFEGWCHNLSRSLGLKPPKIEVHLNYSLVKVDDDNVISNPLTPVGFEVATLKNRQMMTPDCLKGTNHQIMSYQIKLQKGFHYQTGEMIEILPENPPDFVEKVLNTLKLNGDHIFALIANDSTVHTFVPEKVSVKQLFSQYLDLCGPPDRSLLRAFLTVANKEGTDRINKMLDVKQDEGVKQYMKNVNTCEFICEFSQYGIPSVELLLSGCHHIKPRQYLISSSPMRNQNIANILVLNHKFGINNKRNGMCTSYLERPKLKNIHVRISKSSFELPDDCKAPIIMVAVGCGIAPMLSIIQNRGPQNGPSLLIFGSTSKEVHKKLTDEIDKEIANGCVTDVLYAWSNEKIIESDILQRASSSEIEKDTGAKIKEVIMKNKEKVWKYWFDDRTSLYYCGIPGHLPDEIKELLLKITIEEGGLSIEEAMAINNRHQMFVEAF